MSNPDTVPISINILDKEYIISCPKSEQEALLAAARLVNDKIKGVRESGKVIGAERIAVMVALNVANELLQQQSQKKTYSYTMGSRIQSLQEKVEIALNKYRQMELQG